MLIPPPGKANSLLILFGASRGGDGMPSTSLRRGIVGQTWPWQGKMVWKNLRNKKGKTAPFGARRGKSLKNVHFEIWDITHFTRCRNRSNTGFGKAALKPTKKRFACMYLKIQTDNLTFIIHLFFFAQQNISILLPQNKSNLV